MRKPLDTLPSVQSSSYATRLFGMTRGSIHTFRKLLIVGVLLWVAHIVIISALRVSPVKAILSDLIQWGLGVCALLASVRAAQRSRPFAKVFWTLMAAGFGIWCVGQMLGVYFGSILNLSTQQNIYIRARGYYRTGYQNGSESISESVRNAFIVAATPTPTDTPTPTTVFTPSARKTASRSVPPIGPRP